MRWIAVITYRTASGLLEVDYALEELEELQDIVERGPDWNVIVSIHVTLSRVCDPGLVVDEVQEK